MLEELKEEEIVNRLGGRFKLSTLIQKRLVALRTGARVLVSSRSEDKLAVVINEILNDAISLDVTTSEDAAEYTESSTIGMDPNETPASEE